MRDTLIDTSAWIDFFRSVTGIVGGIVAELVQFDKAWITGPVQAELLHGVRGKREIAQLNFLFSTIPCLEVSADDWRTTGDTLQKLREKGLSVPLTDVLIATVAKRNNMPVLTLDKHFKCLPVEIIHDF